MKKKRISTPLLALASLVLVLSAGCDQSYRAVPEDTLASPFKASDDWMDPAVLFQKFGLSGRNAGNMAPEAIAEAAHRIKPTESVYFAFDRSSLEPKEREKLKALQNTLDTQNTTLLIVGRCDWHGTEEYNLSLGERRANTVREYFTDLGFLAENVYTLSKGSLEAEARGTPEACSQDRRADVIIVRS